MKKLSLDKMKNKGAAATAATVAAAGVLIGGAFEAPADILNNDDAALSPPPIVDTLLAETAPDGSDDGDGEILPDEQNEKRRGGIRAKTREFVLRMPTAVRACIAVPLWCVGWAIISLCSLLWTGAISPVGGAILKWLLIVLAVCAALALTAKTVFPRIPLKKLLNKYTPLWILGASTLLCIADVVLQRFYPDFPRLFDIGRAAASAALLIIAIIPVIRRGKKEKRRLEEEEEKAALAAAEAEEEEEEETPEQAQARVEREILELADSVSGR